jgi:hypothetical protein
MLHEERLEPQTSNKENDRKKMPHNENAEKDVR